jgi:hypothetical protein
MAITRRFSFPCLVTLAFVAGIRGDISAQTIFLRGQNVQPAFEGWQHNQDGTFSLFFGYLNRNYEEEPVIPVGANNSFQPGPADRGQPTHFYPRRQQFVFSVSVPADFGKQEIVWTITRHGRTSTAVGSLLPVWEIDPGVWAANRGGGLSSRTVKGAVTNKPPSVSVVGGDTFTVTLPQSLTLTASASDDGQPGPRKNPQGGNNAQGPTQNDRAVFEDFLPVRAKETGPNSQDMVAGSQARETGLAVTWLHYRGAGHVTFVPMSSPIKPDGTELSGKATTLVRFGQPGTYVIRVVADDGVLTSGTNITVIVKGAPGTVTVQ